ncbi:hypothetical protein I3843_11G002600 [Carya illinoinensis]|uniref:Uncharacterized protein n=1 Tax=Carya illinoinensis TaxID=32201 RepID=A0A8T1P1S7_CARIL|nr:hypothetical protein I3760_11G002600 [Carya illinoinensis]KAG6634880.1 hypothetical protein CIPAW_11G002800 [Carya illinoinensis]KAG7954177.1 hypothetical protein I3843_11G002600 [Carya illinoinensis]
MKLLIGFKQYHLLSFLVFGTLLLPWSMSTVGDKVVTVNARPWKAPPPPTRFRPPPPQFKIPRSPPPPPNGPRGPIP